MSKNKKTNETYIKETVVASNIDIEKVIEDTAKCVVEELRVRRFLKEGINYTKKVELLLYNYLTLKDALVQKEEDIKYLDEHGLKEKSKSVVFYQTSSGRVSKEDKYIELKESYKRDIQETERSIRKIDNALEKIKKDKYYSIIELKYLKADEDKLKTDEEIAEKLECDRKTVARNRKRILNKLTTIFFPESIREIM